MATTPATFQDFDAIRIRLGESLASISRAFGALDAVDRAAELDCVRTDLLSDSFRVLVFGEMKRGKSQLINAMLGEPLLPSKPMPCTAIACNVRYGDPKRAVLHRRQENPTETIDLTHSPSALQDAVVIRTFHESDDGLDVELAIERHPFVEADIYAPLALCRLGVEIQDSPGLNENPTRTAEARRKLKSADAVVIVLASDTPLSQSERALVSEVLRDRDAGTSSSCGTGSTRFGTSPAPPKSCAASLTRGSAPGWVHTPGCSISRRRRDSSVDGALSRNSSNGPA
jgi:hypothetical protein